MEKEKKFPCETCGWRKRSEKRPNTFWARVWRWHATWCPGWKKYQAHLKKQAN
ncbi:MAG: hypothetical protein IMY70_07310 [Bacteroidetes bacterium]|nr:hypothetical protein [Bacteroidota bacterium]